MAERGRKRQTVGKVLEVVYADKDSDDENFNCGSDVEFVPDSEYNSACEESDVDDSIIMPQSSYSQDVKDVSRNLSGIYFCVEKLKKISSLCKKIV